MTRIRTHTNPLSIRHRFDDVSYDTLVSNSVKEVGFEVGFGRGQFLRQWASQHPEHFLIGVEVRKSIVRDVQQQIDMLGLTNVSLVHGNASIFLEDVIPDSVLDHVFVFHPDPWFKKRHHKRRVINKQFLTLIYQKLKPTGKLYISTDVELLWQDILLQMNCTSFKALDHDLFWEQLYTSHWHSFSIKDKRQLHFQTFIK